MLEQKKLKNNTGLINRTGGLIKDNAKMARDGMKYYLDTLRKLPGAYMASKEQIKRENLSRKRIRGLGDIQAIRQRIEESKTKISSIGEWVNLAKKGIWSERIKRRLERFDSYAEGLKRKAELLEFDYQYVVNSFLALYKDELDAFFNAADRNENGNSRKLEIAEGLTKIGLIGERAYNLTAQVNKLEEDVEKFVDNKLSGSKKDKLIQVVAKLGSKMVGTGSILKRAIDTAKLVTLGLYYIARILIFVIKYFILIPVTFIKSISGFFKKKRIN